MPYHWPDHSRPGPMAVVEADIEALLRKLSEEASRRSCDFD